MNEFVVYLKHNKSAAVALVLLLFLTLATILTLTLSRRSQELRSKAAIDNGQLTLALGNITDIQPGQSFPLQISLLNGGQAITGADILVDFDQTRLTLISITPGTSPVFKTFAPVTANGTFDTNKVLTTANSTSTVEFGITTYDWPANILTSPTPANTNMSPVAILTFGVKPQAGFGPTTISIQNNGTTSTTDSNIVVIPSGTNTMPEDILQGPGYDGESVTVNIIGAGASPSPSASPCVGIACASPTPPPGTDAVVLHLKLEGNFDTSPLVHADQPKVTVTFTRVAPAQTHTQTMNLAYDPVTKTFNNQNDPASFDITPGLYELWVKGHVHLSRRFFGVSLLNGTNTLSFIAPGQMLIAGDAINNVTEPNLPPPPVSNTDNKIDLDDFTYFVSKYGPKKPEGEYSFVDFNYDDDVYIDDFGPLSAHYNATGEQ